MSKKIDLNNNVVQSVFYNNIIPVTLHTIKKCKEVSNEKGLYEYEHLRFRQIKCIGIINNITNYNSYKTYFLDDMTSKGLHAKLIKQQNESLDENNNDKKEFKIGQYVKVFGKVETVNEHNYILVFNMSPIKELNEITHHILEAMNASIYQCSKLDSVNEKNS